MDDAEVARLAARLTGAGAATGGVLGVAHEGAGWDHQAWRVDTADGPWIVRTAKEATPAERAAEVRREVAVMQLVRRRLGGWAADAIVLDEPTGCLAHRRVPGTPLQDLLAAGAIGEAATAAIARTVGVLIAAIGALDPGDVGEPLDVDDDGPAAWKADVPNHLPGIEHLVSSTRRAAIDEFLASPDPPPAPRLALQHNDLGAEHVIVDDGTISGIIDWSDVAVGDPSTELGRLLRDLGPVGLEHVLDGYGAAGAERDGLAARARCYARCVIVEDLAYAVEHRPTIVPFELACLDRLYDLA